jgi:hypothetical protein
MLGTVVFDIDGVLADTARAAYVAATDGRLDPILRFNLSDQESHISERMLDLFRSVPFNLLAPVVPGALQMVKELKADGIRMIALTARPDSVVEVTAAWMYEWFPEIEQVIFVEHGHKKSDYLNEYSDVIAFIDDSGSNINDVLMNTCVPLVIAPKISCQDYSINDLSSENRALIKRIHRGTIGLESNRLMHVPVMDIAAIIKLVKAASLLK